MIQNYAKVAFRNLRSNKAFTAINITGLAIGIATSLIILLYISHELSYDRFNKRSGDIVRVVFRGHVKSDAMNESHVFPPVAQTLKNECPEIEEAVRIKLTFAPIISLNDKTFEENNYALADASLFKVFTIPLLNGDPNTALTDPNTIVISKAIASKYFGDQNPVGQLLHFKNTNQDMRVTGVYDKIPENAHFHFDMIGSLTGFPDASSNSWMTSGYHTYLLLRPGSDYQKLQAKLPAIMDKYMAPQMEQSMHLTLKEFRAAGNDIGIYLQPLTDIHLHSNFPDEMEPAGDMKYIYIFGAIVLFMILIACINFMNLTTANAIGRVKEVAMRKVLGAPKNRLVLQFLLESISITLIATLLAAILAVILLPSFNQLAQRNLSISGHDLLWLIPGLFLFAVVVGTFAGIYPAWFLSSFKPEAALKRSFSPGGKQGNRLRSGLVVFQFFISITLMVSTAVVYKQLSYIQHKKLGYNKDQVIILNQADHLDQAVSARLRSIIQQDSRVADITTSGFIPSGPTYNNNFFIFENGTSAQVKSICYEIDEHYINVMGMTLAEGRNFSPAYSTDSTAVIINQAAVKAMGWTGNVIGKTFRHLSNEGIGKEFHVVGVVNDFHFKSMHSLISPLVMKLSENYGNILIKTNTKDVTGLLATLQKEWEQLNVDTPFSYSFLDQRFEDTYKSEANVGRILAIFAGLTVFVACLGVFGLATFTAKKRSKEISVRKVLGASVTSIITMLSADFLKLVIIAFAVAGPVAWYMMNNWLQGFAYRVNISWWIFAVSALTAILITLLTVGTQAIKAAIANPVKNLKAD
ncbi:ABC transporter permease [Chitinophaga sp. Cy-1792]|uniref:ABC transporter permease n=1 Tax=Chitinophaga sp. Cy-1792 TaxID=2608339 RepID=UPI00141D8E3E|nr:ABC transporter permease [Chitinophaga sp. Cy-1792]NIG53090.1 FtsX-like permease family protein [Chitinophaga sp. Cy-1792]